MTTNVLIAGIPRSGSTWLYNAARLAILEAGRSVNAAWFEDYQAEKEADFQLVKVHGPDTVPLEPDITLTSQRATEDCVSSLIRMGWVSEDPDAIRKAWADHQKLRDFWKQKSDLEVTFEDIVSAPEEAVTAIAEKIGLSLSEAQCTRVVEQLSQLSPPAEGSTFDPVTLLHPKHKRSASEHVPSAEYVREICQS
ncbi:MULTISPECIES: hypothetical protein [unclassified Ruegeria]|uniref:hypothetical protein n=1 Tax=unclassified Ruegeria TaxID=2625375 RepID=UPI001488D368|nr:MULTISPECIES: hypothetical protein [unclassified Ruegeria]